MRSASAVARLLNQKSAAKLLKDHGWTQTTGGKHSVKMAKRGRRPITLPRHKGQDYGAALTRSILRAAGLDPDDL